MSLRCFSAVRRPILTGNNRRLVGWHGWPSICRMNESRSFCLNRCSRRSLRGGAQRLFYHVGVRGVAILLFLVVGVAAGAIAGAISPSSTATIGARSGLLLGGVFALGVALASLLGHWVHGTITVSVIVVTGGSNPFPFRRARSEGSHHRLAALRSSRLPRRRFDCRPATDPAHSADRPVLAAVAICIPSRHPDSLSS